MPHVQGSDLTARAALTPDAAALALSLVEAAICPGVPDVLTQTEREARVPYDWQTFRRKRRISCTVLGAWPIRNLLEVSAAGEDVAAYCTFSPFALYLNQRAHITDSLHVRFVTGYADGELPAPLKAAVVQLGSKLLEGELDVSRISWGEGVSTTYMGATAEMLPKSVLDLIAPWQFTSFT